MVGAVGLLGLAWQSLVRGAPPTASLLAWTPPSPTQNEKWGPMQPGHGLWSHLHLQTSMEVF